MSLVKTNAITTVAGKPILNSSGSIIQTVYVRSDAFTTYSAAASGDDTKDIIEKKQELRDITKLPDTIESVNDLKTHWDETLLETSSPYT